MKDIKFSGEAAEKIKTISEDAISRIKSIKTQMPVSFAKKHYVVYAGTVPDPEKKRRRKAGKAARKARKINYGL